MLTDLIQEAFKQLRETGLAAGTLESYQTRAFHPIEDLYGSKHATQFDRGWLTGLEDDFRQQGWQPSPHCRFVSRSSYQL